jgi:hypothetical protein
LPPHTTPRPWLQTRAHTSPVRTCRRWRRRFGDHSR